MRLLEETKHQLIIIIYQLFIKIVKVDIIQKVIFLIQ